MLEIKNPLHYVEANISLTEMGILQWVWGHELPALAYGFTYSKI